MKTDSQHISSMKMPGMLYGTVIRSEITHGTISSISAPNIPGDFVLIGSKDIPGSNAVKILNEKIQLLAGEKVNFKGQMILALFGPDPESVSQTASRIEINYEPTPAEQMPIDTVHMEKQLAWGDVDKEFAAAEETLELAYLTGSQTSRSTTPIGAFTYLEDDKIIVHAATQWPFHLRNAVSEVCGLSKKRVVVFQNSYYPTQDEKLLYPSYYASLSAIATLKTGKPARLIDGTPAYRPEMIITRKTALDAEKSPLAEIIDIQVNQGAVPLFSKELLEHVTHGAAPMYGLKACRITAQILQTPSPARNHFGGLGSSLALYSSEAHASNLAVRSGMNPANWRIKYLKEDAGKARRGIKIKHALLRELIEQTVERSDFSRKFAAYEMQKRRQRRLSTFTGYARGIGIAAGFGLNGFSSGFTPLRTYTASVTLDVNDTVTISTSLMLAHAAGVWKKIAGNNLGIDTRDITIASGSTSKLPNSGPDVLHRDITVISLLIDRCCDSIKSQRFKEPLPITAKRSLKSIEKGVEEQTSRAVFINSSWGTAAVELEIDPTEIVPIILGVWTDLYCGKVFNKRALLQDIRSEILQEITILCRSEQGILSIPNIDIRLTSREEASTLSPIGAVRGLIDAAYAAAISQAVNQEVTMIPAGPQELLEFIGEHE
jgi:CO/xanthine dehydrogenase Mo-binding subunit